MSSELIEMVHRTGEDAYYRDDLSLEDYHGDKDWLSKTGWNYLIDCPARFRAWRDGLLEKKETESMRIGTAAHAYVNEYEKFVRAYHVMPDSIVRNAAQAPYKMQLRIAAGREILKEKELERVVAIGKALKDDPRGRILLEPPTDIERSFFWRDPITGIRNKSRPDVLRSDDVVVDLKVTADVQPEAFSKTAWGFGYDLSVALTARVFEGVTGRPLQGYIFLAIEKGSPHLVEAYDAFAPFDPTGLTYLKVGEYRLQQAIELYQSCSESGIWPGYSNEVNPMKVPDFRLRTLERDMSR